MPEPSRSRAEMKEAFRYGKEKENPLSIEAQPAHPVSSIIAMICILLNGIIIASGREDAKLLGTIVGIVGISGIIIYSKRLKNGVNQPEQDNPITRP